MKRGSQLAGNVGSFCSLDRSGAFSTTSADRTISVSVAPDYDAHLKLTDRDSDEHSKFDGASTKLKFENSSAFFPA